MKLKIVCSFLLWAILQNTHAQVRSTIDFNADWEFYLGKDTIDTSEKLTDTSWRKVTLPHDWSIEGKFSKKNPATTQGGALPGGIGWYRKIFTVPAAAKNKNISVEFDGVYRNSEVWINGHSLGKRPNGYASFEYDLTTYINEYPKKNIIVVKVNNSQQPDSRWYTGSGIYRDVKLVIKNAVSINYNGLYFPTSVLSKRNGQWDTYSVTGETYGNVNFNNISIGNTTAAKKNVEVEFVLKDKAGKVVKQSKHSATVDPSGGSSFGIDRTDGVWGVANPVLWSPQNPYLYNLVTNLYVEGKLVDAVSTNIGFRQFNFDSSKGFFLNGQSLKIKGVCLHHDLGALGAAFNKTAAKRQLTILKEMGCNAIRFSHNPPAAAMLDLCDEMGFLVMDEAFDMWKKKKNKFDYHQDFEQWYEKDLQEMVLRDRNHPSVFMWSIGNEIREQFDSTGTAIAKELVYIVKRLDSTRPVTSALTENFAEKNFIYQSKALDVLGFNYKLYDYAALPTRFSGQKFIATETASALATRGVYDQPSDSMHIWPPDSKPFTGGNKDFTASAYDNTFAYWGATHEKAWQAVKQNDFMAGCFVWSGFDFLGEPVPYPTWPARSSYYGIVDLAGFPKDVYYMYQSEWTNKTVLHIFPHWNWEKGKTVDVWAYYSNADEVELFLNGKSLGVKKKEGDALHVMWRVPFVPGTLKAISRKNGKTVLNKEIKTAGAPAKIELTADKKQIKAGGKDLSYITARILDKDGNVVPDANNLITFSITGNAILSATDNGYQADTVSFSSHKRQAWKGMALAIIKSSQKKGNSTLIASAPGLLSGTIALNIAD